MSVDQYYSHQLGFSCSLVHQSVKTYDTLSHLIVTGLEKSTFSPRVGEIMMRPGQDFSLGPRPRMRETYLQRRQRRPQGKIELQPAF